MKRKARRLIWHLFPSYVLAALVIVVPAMGYVLTELDEFYKENTRESLISEAFLLRDHILGILDLNRPDLLDTYAKKAGSSVSTRITVITPYGKVIADSIELPEEMENHKNRPEIKEALKGFIGYSTRYSTTLEKRMMYVALPIQKKQEAVAVVRTARPLESIDSAVSALRKKIIMHGVLLAMAFTLICFLVSKKISSHLEKLRKGIESIGGVELNQKSLDRGIFEIEILAATVDQMSEKLGQQMQHLTDQKNHVNTILSSMSEGVITVDPEERIIDANPAAALFFNKEQSNLMGNPIQMAVRNSKFHRFVRNSLDQDGLLEMDFILQGKEERIIFARGTSLYDSRNQKKGIVVVMSDNTRLVRLETIKKDLTLNIAHELKTPLTTINGYTETLLAEELNDPDHIRYSLEKIKKNIKRLISVSNELDLISRIEKSGDLRGRELELASVNLSDLAKGAIEAVQSVYPELQAEIRLICHESLIAHVNSVLMKKAVYNLIENAVRFGVDKGEVSVHVEEMDGKILIRVKDNGMGISKQDQERIFERFYRIEKSRNRKSGGAGLGLSVARHIVRAHGGELSVESIPGQGSVFTISLSGQKKQCKRSQDAASAALPGT